MKADNGNGVVFEEQFSIVLRDSDGDVPSTFELVLIAEDGGDVSGAGTFETGNAGKYRCGRIPRVCVHQLERTRSERSIFVYYHRIHDGESNNHRSFQKP